MEKRIIMEIKSGNHNMLQIGTILIIIKSSTLEIVYNKLYFINIT